MVSLLRLQKNFPLKFVLSRVILKACGTESKQGNNRGKKPLASLVIQAVSIPWRVSRKTTLHMSSFGKYNRKSHLHCSEEKKRIQSQGITVGKPPLHLLSFMQSVYPDGFRGKRPSICQVSVNKTENPICTARKKKEDTSRIGHFTAMDGSEAGVDLVLKPTLLLYYVNQVVLMLTSISQGQLP